MDGWDLQVVACALQHPTRHMHEVVTAVRRRLTFLKGGGFLTRESVFCPAGGSSVALTQCKVCSHLRALSVETITCSVPCPFEAGPKAPAVLGSRVRVTVVRGDVPTTALAQLERDPTWPAPVVDAGDRFIGFLRERGPSPRWPWHRSAPSFAAEMAACPTRVVRETEPLERALRVMAHCGARYLALIDSKGVLQGVLLDVDALRLVAP